MVLKSISASTTTMLWPIMFDRSINPVRRKMTNTPTSELRQNFDHFDANGDGKIDLVEFTRLMDALGACEPGEDPLIGFRAIDADGSGIIEFDEFEAWFSDQ